MKEGARGGGGFVGEEGEGGGGGGGGGDHKRGAREDPSRTVSELPNNRYGRPGMAQTDETAHIKIQA